MFNLYLYIFYFYFFHNCFFFILILILFLSLYYRYFLSYLSFIIFIFYYYYFLFGKKHSSAGAVFQCRNWASAGEREITIIRIKGVPAITSHHDVAIKAPVRLEKE